MVKAEPPHGGCYGTRHHNAIVRQSPRAYNIAMSHHCGRYEKFTNRRDFLKKAGAGFGLLALADLLQGDGLIAADIEPARSLDPMAPRRPHYPAKAKSIIWLFMEGAPSSGDLFDPKPELTKRDGQSEEHTSELQSQSNLVCRLLLEKKKKKK